MKLGLFVLLFPTLLLLSCTEEKMEVSPQPPPYAAPEFALKNIYNQDVKLLNYKNKPVIINFWATWCVPCIKEMPELDRFYRAKKNDGLAILMINLKESKSVVEKFIKTHGYAFQVLLDESGSISEEFRVFGLPTTYFINRQGMIVYTHMGSLTKEILYSGYNTILEKKK